jgi:pimeloyl-ACP methyl ester carboxylesterase
MVIYAEAAVLIVLLRMGGAGDAVLAPPWAGELVAGVWLALAAWVAGGLLHAWVPLWQMLLLGLGLGTSLAMGRAWGVPSLQPVADLLAIGALGVLSVIPVDVPWIAAAAVTFAALGYLLDRAASALPGRGRRLLQLAPLAVLAAIGLNVRQPDDFGSRLLAEDPLFPLRLAFAVPLPGSRLQFESGSVAWELAHPGGAARGSAILVHGNHPAGSWQPAAIALQGALCRAGYEVLSVDHPGYGASPHPPPDAGWQAWDPRIGLREAMHYLQQRDAGAGHPVIVVSHSMGVETALLWLDEGSSARNVYLFAGTIEAPRPEREGVRLFYEQHRVPCCLPPGTLRQVLGRFYQSAENYARQLPADHPTITFVRFGIEYGDVAVGRDALYASIPAPERRCDFPGVTHYFNTLSVRRFILVDTGAVMRTAALFAASAPGAASACPLPPG